MQNWFLFLWALRKKIEVDENVRKYILFRTDVYFTEYLWDVEIDEKYIHHISPMYNQSTNLNSSKNIGIWRGLASRTQKPSNNLCNNVLNKMQLSTIWYVASLKITKHCISKLSLFYTQYLYVFLVFYIIILYNFCKVSV